MENYRLIAEAVERYDDEKPECTLDEFVEDYVRDYYSSKEIDNYYKDDGVSPYAYQQDLIDLRRYER